MSTLASLSITKKIVSGSKLIGFFRLNPVPINRINPKSVIARSIILVAKNANNIVY
jgi:hypothetical protein